MGHTKKKPDWADKSRPDIFATHIVDGTEQKKISGEQGFQKRKKKPLSVDMYKRGVLDNNKSIIGRAITLIESNSRTHLKEAQALLKALTPYTGKALRIGISGVPGAGKSTLIEALGLYLIKLGFKVAVLAVDPSSSLTGGSVLGDKTRMEQLAKEPECFIRPSPSGGSLGGVTRKSRETILICEAAGYDVILVETVGVGQNEITVRSMVDCFLLVMIAGAGDELQGIKKGVVEITDILVVNKTDGDNVDKALMAANEYRQAFKYLSNATEGWKTRVLNSSALKETGIDDIWTTVKAFEQHVKRRGLFEDRRVAQRFEWVKSMVENHIIQEFYQDESVKALLSIIENELMNGSTLPTEAAEKLLRSRK